MGFSCTFLIIDGFKALGSKPLVSTFSMHLWFIAASKDGP